MTKPTLLMIAAAVAAGCMGRDKGSDRSTDQAPGLSERTAAAEAPAAAAPPALAAGGAAAPADEREQRDKDGDAGRGRLLDDAKSTFGAQKRPAPAGGKRGGGETATRSWFPETFLFEPLVVTDADGGAVLRVRVPDRLTTWRVLALAHARTGAQGGAVASFLGTLPTYVDLVVPPFLVVGDELRLPIQAVNTTDRPVTAALAVTADGAAITAPAGQRTIPADGSIVEYARLRATTPGLVTVEAAIGAADAVQRKIDVVPLGKPITVLRSGTLAAPRTLTLDGPAGSDPATDRVRLVVYPGALALLRSELGVSLARGGVHDDGYALLLAGRAGALLAALGDKADPDALRELALVAGQRAIRHARTLDVVRAAALAEPALAHPGNPVLARLGERAAAYLASNQRPDGTFAGGAGWTLQRVLVATAEAAGAVAAQLDPARAGGSATVAQRQRATGVLVKAGGAFQRNFNDVVDGYTAAAILATGAISGPLVEQLRTRVRDAIRASADGARYLVVGDGVVRPDSSPPGTAEATALAVLALAGDPKAPLADLGATLLGSYDPARGWGDGHANLVCMRAVLELFKTPVPDGVTIALAMDGKPIAGGTLDRAKLRDVLALDVAAPGLAGSHVWTVTATPALPGLGYSLALRGWVPWPRETARAGLELALPAALAGRVGRPIEIAATAIAPSGLALHIQHALPAGVQVDRPSLDALVAAGTIARYETADGKLDLHVAPLQPGATFGANYRVIPTLAGKLHTGASWISAGSSQFHLPPTEWTID